MPSWLKTLKYVKRDKNTRKFLHLLNCTIGLQGKLMPVTHSQKSCTSNLFKSTCTRNLTVCLAFLYVFSCTRILHQIKQNSIGRKKLSDTWPKLRDMTGQLVCWLLTICCFVVCVVCRCFFIVCKFLVYEICIKIQCKFLVQDSWLCVTGITVNKSGRCLRDEMCIVVVAIWIDVFHSISTELIQCSTVITGVNRDQITRCPHLNAD